MKKDFSVIPANKKITNETDNAVKFDLRDNWKQITVALNPKDVMEVTVTTSEGLAILDRKCKDLGLKLEDVSAPAEA